MCDNHTQTTSQVESVGTNPATSGKTESSGVATTLIITIASLLWDAILALKSVSRVGFEKSDVVKFVNTLFALSEIPEGIASVKLGSATYSLSDYQLAGQLTALVPVRAVKYDAKDFMQPDICVHYGATVCMDPVEFQKFQWALFGSFKSKPSFDALDTKLCTKEFGTAGGYVLSNGTSVHCESSDAVSSIPVEIKNFDSSWVSSYYFNMSLEEYLKRLVFVTLTHLG